MERTPAKLVARAFAILFAISAIDRAFYLPTYMVELFHYSGELNHPLHPEQLNNTIYLFRISVLQVAHISLDAILFLVLAVWFARCGPLVLKVLGWSSRAATSRQ
jgi:hypothetical protein